MASTISKLLCHALSIAFAIGGGARCLAQANVQHNSSYDSLQVPKLCMPVSYRQSFPNLPIKTRIGMLEDRYLEVNEALSGWGTKLVYHLLGRVNGAWEAVPCGDDTRPFLYCSSACAANRLDCRSNPGRVSYRPDRSVSNRGNGGSVADCFWSSWQRTLAAVPIAAGSYFSFKMGDVYVVQSSVVMMLIPWLIYALKANVRSWLRFLIVSLSGIILGLAQWVRTQSGTPVLVFFAVLICFSALRRSIRILLFSILLIGMTLPLLYAQLPLRERERFLAAHPPAYTGSLNHHLLWHAAYFGLSYLTNPYVSTLRDSAPRGICASD